MMMMKVTNIHHLSKIGPNANFDEFLSLKDSQILILPNLKEWKSFCPPILKGQNFNSTENGFIKTTKMCPFEFVGNLNQHQMAPQILFNVWTIWVIFLPCYLFYGCQFIWFLKGIACLLHNSWGLVDLLSKWEMPVTPLGWRSEWESREQFPKHVSLLD